MSDSSLGFGHWSLPAGSAPPVLCLCPTYGRFELLRLALACFLEQDYPGSKHLLILNDAPRPIGLPGDRPDGIDEVRGALAVVGEAYGGRVTVKNRVAPFANLGYKRQALLEMAWTPVVAHWDDDDLYLPHHLSRSVGALLGPHDGRPGGRHAVPGCVKSRGAWYMVGESFRGIHHNVFEGSMVFRREEALALGGYPPKHSGQALALMRKFERLGTLYKIPDGEGGCPSYVYRWGQKGVGHISAYKNRPESMEQFAQANTDFGDGRPLTPGDLTPYWDAHRRYIEERLAEKAAT